MMPDTRSAAIGVLALILLTCSTATMSETADEVIATERRALERWGRGDPDGFLGTYAEEITYFDPTREGRVDGRQAMVSLLAPIRGKLRVDRFEMVDPKVQRHGEIAVLTYNLVNYARQPDGDDRETSRWNSTAVYRCVAGRWRTIHSHWSYTKPASR